VPLWRRPSVQAWETVARLKTRLLAREWILRLRVRRKGPPGDAEELA
jgi:hypothetical protein